MKNRFAITKRGAKQTVHTQSPLFEHIALYRELPLTRSLVCNVLFRHRRQPTTINILKKERLFARYFFTIIKIKLAIFKEV